MTELSKAIITMKKRRNALLTAGYVNIEIFFVSILSLMLSHSMK